MKAICEDLAAEGQALDDIVANISDEEWDIVTPFDGWTVKAEIAHIAFFDYIARLSASDKESFDMEMTKMIENFDRLFEVTLEPGMNRSNQELLAWWRAERKAMIDAYLACDPKQRLPWHIPMSARSSATARLMETWAHGQDVVDALCVKREATDRLKHIAHLGVATFGWSFKVRDLTPPDAPVRVELTGPSGDLWTWGDKTAADKIVGDAEDFCLVVIQRRHFKDTKLEVIGDTAEKWMSVAQVFAGPPAEGPKPGSFPKS
ncbi:wyosine base formation [Desulfatibacillum aliphaticivorans]|uniref:Wyosine base formation n=1 Tax=Desulfatibacillum aliphaticivorans TaxID=218208 RepID=B8FIW2_DESAL|nr:TIGR03084 family metal-binding protein [Desulfatibacillum aliphaticivorans]ACL04353.1 wyosine base formation [Desulfatibacillum aliphaticivorans]